jgi:carbamoyltransferase
VYTLGINAVFHDSSATLVEDGIVIAAAEEERFTSIKHAKRPVPFSSWELPFHAIDFCLARAGLNLADVDHVAYSFDPHLILNRVAPGAAIPLPLEPSAHPTSEHFSSPWEALQLSYVVNAPRQLADGAPLHLKKRFVGLRPEGGPYRWHFVEHHTAHAASAFLPSPFPSAAVLTLDGRGEVATTSYSVAQGPEMHRLGEVRMPHSLGLLYEAVTDYLGFLHSSDEYKVMALASFGKPSFLPQFREIVQLRGDGQYTVAPLRLVERFGPARERGGPLDQRHYDIASSLQIVLEETVLELVHWLQRETGEKDLCMAGGVALNCVMNSRIEREGPFQRVWVQPAAGDAGTSLGAALWVDSQVRHSRDWSMDAAYLGPDFSDEEVQSFLRWSKAPYRTVGDPAVEAARLLAGGKVIGWFQGRMEFGPRALGARSIIASPIPGDMQARLNDIKDREDFRPVAPVVLEEEVSNWFDCSHPSPFMLFVYDVRPEKAGQIPAVQHIDGTARIQTINSSQHPLYYRLLKEFHARTGVPVLVNTSFNTRGEPIVCSPRHALESFWTSPLDALVIGSFVVEKERCR